MQISLGKAFALFDQEAQGFVHQTLTRSKLQEYIPIIQQPLPVLKQGNSESQPATPCCIFLLLKNACVVVICVEQTGKRTSEEDSESLRPTLPFPFHVLPTVPLFNTILCLTPGFSPLCVSHFI